MEAHLLLFVPLYFLLAWLTDSTESKRYYWRRKEVSTLTDDEASEFVKVGTVIIGRRIGRQQTIRTQLCPDNRQAVAACISGLCGGGFDCINGSICCYGSGSFGFQARCIDGSSPSGTCRGVGSPCPPGTSCTTALICCRPFAPNSVGPFPGTSTFQAACPFGAISGLPCLTNACPIGYNCVNNVCCLQGYPNPPAGACPGGTLTQGFCRNGLCPVGYTCFNNYCCSVNTNTGGGTLNFCPNGQIAGAACVNGLCSPGYTCLGNLCCQTTIQSTVCPTGVPSTAACTNGLCGVGYQCINGVCCQTGVVATVPPPVVNNVCPSGQAAVSVCTNGLCGVGFQCINNVCCSSTVPTQTLAPQTIVCPNGIVANVPCNYATSPQTGCQVNSGCYNGACCPLSSIPGK